MSRFLPSLGLVLMMGACASHSVDRQTASLLMKEAPSCLGALKRLLGLGQDSFIDTESPQKIKLRSFIVGLEAEYLGANLLEPQTLYLLTRQIDWTDFERLFLNEASKPITPRKLNSRLLHLADGSSFSAYGPSSSLSKIYDWAWIQSGGNTEQVIPTFKKRWDEMLRLAPDKEGELLQEIDLRRTRASLQRILDDRQLFEARVVENRLILPDGSSLVVRSKKKNGDIVVLIPVEKVVPGQDKIWQDTVVKYQNDKTLKDMVFWGDLYPDGRIQIIDQHHRISAYSKEISKDVPFEIKAKSIDGEGHVYFTSSYLKALQFREGNILLNEDSFQTLRSSVESIVQSDFPKSEKQERLRDVQRTFYERVFRPIQKQ